VTNDDERDYAEEAYNRNTMLTGDGECWCQYSPGDHRIHNPMCPVHGEPIECLDEHKGGCQGEVRYRQSLTGTGTAIPRCDKHWQDRLDFQEQHTAIYPDSAIAPSWFDPEAAGERWEED